MLRLAGRTRLARAEIDAFRPKIGGAGLLRGPAKHVGSPGNLKVHETGSFHQGFQLCFQQSAGYSTSPEVYHLLGRLRHRHFNQDVGKLKPASGF